MNRLKELRKKTGFTQKSFSKEIGIPLRTLQNWENGESNIKPEKAELLAEYFNVPVSYLLGYDDNDFEKRIRIDVLNDIINKLHKTHISLFETTDKTAFWAGFEAAELIVQTQKMILDFEESANGK